MNEIRQDDQPQIVLVDNEDQLKQAVSVLEKSNVLALDTEFDRMRTKFGMNLELIQIYDGSNVFLIRACLIKDISALKPIIEDSNIIKLIYSAGEDIPALISRGLFLKGLYDLQVASKLAGLEANSYVQLIKELCGVDLSKSQQQSNWRASKLSDQQMAYAANDVIYNIQVYLVLKEKIKANNTEQILDRKNKAIEGTQLKKFEPRLKAKHREHNIPTQRKILKLLQLRAQIAEKRDVPPIYVFPDELIDELIIAGTTFHCISSFKNCPKTYKLPSPARDFINKKIKSVLMS